MRYYDWNLLALFERKIEDKALLFSYYSVFLKRQSGIVFWHYKVYLRTLDQLTVLQVRKSQGHLAA